MFADGARSKYMLNSNVPPMLTIYLVLKSNLFNHIKLLFPSLGRLNCAMLVLKVFSFFSFLVIGLYRNEVFSANHGDNPLRLAV